MSSNPLEFNAIAVGTAHPRVLLFPLLWLLLTLLTPPLLITETAAVASAPPGPQLFLAHLLFTWPLGPVLLVPSLVFLDLGWKLWQTRPLEAVLPLLGLPSIPFPFLLGALQKQSIYELMLVSGTQPGLGDLTSTLWKYTFEPISAVFSWPWLSILYSKLEFCWRRSTLCWCKICPFWNFLLPVTLNVKILIVGIFLANTGSSSHWSLEN